MKNVLTLLALLLITNLTFSQTTAIPDAIFEQALIDQGLDDILDGEVLTANINTVTTLNVDSLGITDLTGIEDFAALEILRCNSNNLTNLNVSNNSSLWLLNFVKNDLTSIDVSNNLELRHLNFDDNSLTDLDITLNTEITYLTFSRNSLSSIDLSNNTKIVTFNCEENLLTSLDLTNDTALVNLSCGRNSIGTLDLSNNPKLAKLTCHYNPLFTLDLSNNPMLYWLWCANDSLTGLDLTNNPELEILITNSNPDIINLDLSNNPKLIGLTSGNNGFTDLDLSNNPLLERLYVGLNKLTSLDLSNNPNLITLGCGSNAITSLNLTNNPKLTRVWCSSNQLTSIDFRNGNNGILDSINIQFNPDLYCVAVDNPWLSYSTWLEPLYMKDDKTHYTDGSCRSNKISGVAYFDENQNCIQDPEELGAPKVIIKAVGSTEIFSMTDDNGNYEILVNPHETYQLSIASAPYHNLLKGFCPADGNSVNSGDYFTTTENINFGLEMESCALLNIDITKHRMRRCFSNPTRITYQNLGTVDQLNAEIFIDFPEYVELVSASENYTVEDEEEKIYKFSFDTIKAFSEGLIKITDSVICWNEDIRGYTQCIKAWITPRSSCGDTKDTSGWDKSQIVVLGHRECDGIHATFTIVNQGRDMQSTHQYRIYYDNELAYTGSFQLQSKEELLVNAIADGSTIRLEADQHPAHPGNSRPRATIEGCGAENPYLKAKPEASLGKWCESPLDDLDPDIAEVCLEIRDSYDPNDKNVSPAGITENNYVPENEPLEYTIRFQNTGTDTAFNVIIIDTLSNQLDLETFSITGASHEYTYDISSVNSAVLAFKFLNINLPDSNVNEPGSHGFISFSITPIIGITPGTEIENFADIYFDFNSAIRTNTTAIVALDTVISTNKSVTITEGELPALGINNDRLNINIYPNPANNYITISGANEEFNQLNIYDITGKLLINETITNAKQKVNVVPLETGIYFIHLENDHGENYIFKMMKE